ncbi:hypothetical protein ACLB2K_020851 [Fragaria x ananassa]
MNGHAAATSQGIVSRFSDLPDGVPEHILSFLTIKDIARVCCVSKKYSKLHPSSLALSSDESLSSDATFDLVVGVTNKGPIDGSHVVLAFWKPPSSQGLIGAPNLQLVGFERVEVKYIEAKSLTMRVDVCKGLNLVDSEGKRKLVTGLHTILVGSPSEQQVKHYLNVKHCLSNMN